MPPGLTVSMEVTDMELTPPPILVTPDTAMADTTKKHHHIKKSIDNHSPKRSKLHENQEGDWTPKPLPLKSMLKLSFYESSTQM
jgi:hypothetical protein